MTTEPDRPLTPTDCDLRDFAFMPLDVVRLRDSAFTARATGDEFRAGVLLWCASWHQIPAGSLPSDDTELSALAGYGRVVKEWRKVKVMALHGWALCEDGRLYHETIAEKANESWRAKLRQRWATEAARIRKYNERHKTNHKILEFEEWLSEGCPIGQTPNVTRDIPDMSQGQTCETASKGQGQGQGESSLRSEATPSVLDLVEASDQSQQKRKKTNKTAIDIVFPPWWPSEKWAEFAEMRRAKRATLTPEASRLAIKKLTEMREEGQDILSVLDQSIFGNYTGLFPVKQQNGAPNGTSSSNHQRSGASTAHQRHLEGLAMLVDEADRRSEEVQRPGELALPAG